MRSWWKSIRRQGCIWGGALLALVGLQERSPAHAQLAEEHPLSDLSAMHEACRDAEGGEHERLYSVLLDGPTVLDSVPGEEDGQVVFAVASARYLRAFGGRVQVVPAHLERVGFVAAGERVAAFEVARARGVRVRIGFFLGFDEPERRACLVRPPQSVTAVRADMAYAELLDADGRVLARDDTDRLRAWADDPDRRPREAGATVSVGAPNVPGVTLPESWARALRTPATRAALLACHAAGVGRGVSADAVVHLRLRVDARSGRVEDAVVEVGNVGDDDENACLAEAFRRVELSPLGGESRSLDVRVPLQLHAH